jgi:hypothetical protein
MGTYVDDWNSHYINVFIPNIVWIILCLLLGVIGNSCVLFIYIFKMKQHREDRYFIPILALVDLMASIFASIYQFTDYFGLIMNIHRAMSSGNVSSFECPVHIFVASCEKHWHRIAYGMSLNVKQYLKNIFMARKRLKSRQILPKTSLVLEYNIEHNLI